MTPFISCICPTRNRQDLIGLAITSFLNQTYENRELLIVDNGMNSTNVPADPRIRYIRIPPIRLLVTGQMRNLCCENARGEIIAHFDDDDWSHPLRLEEQLARLKDGIQVVGYNLVQFWDEDKKRAFELKTGEAALGTSQMYFKSYWERHHFRPQKFKEDIHFSNEAQKAGVLDMTSGIGRLVARRHSHNTWGAKTRIDTNPEAWQDVAVGDLPIDFWKDKQASGN